MKPESDIRAEIEAGERWLASQIDHAGAAATEAPMEAIRRRAAVALAERWLAGQLGALGQSPAGADPQTPADLVARVQHRVHRELDRREPDRRELERPTSPPAAFDEVVLTHPRFFRWRRWAGSIAAMIAFAALVGQFVWRTEPAQARPSAYDMLLASLDAPISEEDVALSMLDDDIRSLELSVFDPSADTAVDDALYKDIFDDSERLLAELEADIGA